MEGGVEQRYVRPAAVHAITGGVAGCTQDATGSFVVLTCWISVDQFRVLREKGTEAPFTGEYDKHMPSAGVYTCAGCDAPLYKANHKFKSGCGWPAYFDSIPGAVTRHTDSTFGMQRTEIVCSNCGGHLGHVFKGEGYPTPTDERHCVNSISLKFHEKEEGGEGNKVAGNGEAK